MRVNNVREDGETGFKVNIIKNFCNDTNISLFFKAFQFI